jgi:hypothetical protein
MSEYVLGHDLKGERKRLALMSELLDPMHRRHIETLEIIKPGARTLEVGCGNGSISAWLADRVSPGGTAVAFDLDLSLIEVMQKRPLRIWLQARARAARFYSLSLIFSLSVSPRRRRSERSGKDGSRGRANAESITTSGATWRRDSQRCA